MICRGLANELITRFGYRRPSDAENREFRETLDEWRRGGAGSGSRGQNLAIEAGIIEKKLPGIITGFFQMPPAIVLGDSSRELKIGILMDRLKQGLSLDFDRVIARHSGPVVEFLRSVRSGLRTSVMVIGLNYKMIARKLALASTKAKDEFQKLSNQGLEVIKDIAGVPQQSIFHSLINFLSGRGLVEEMNSDRMIMNNKFDKSKFEFAEDGYGVNFDSVDEYQKQHKQECERNIEFKRNFEDSLNKPIFGCPAKRVSITLVIDDREQAVNYVEAVYRLSEKQVRPIFS